MGRRIIFPLTAVTFRIKIDIANVVQDHLGALAWEKRNKQRMFASTMYGVAFIGFG
jgi:hypothetical protein